MTRRAWESLAPPPGVGPTAQPTCSDEARIARIAGNPLSVAATAAGVVACGYDSVYGQYVLSHSAEFNSRYRVSDLDYLFSHDRLYEIRFEASIDAYDDVVAWAKSLCGSPAHTAWDRIRVDGEELSRVRQTWDTPAGVIGVLDPSSAMASLSVELIDPQIAPKGAFIEASGQ